MRDLKNNFISNKKVGNRKIKHSVIRNKFVTVMLSVFVLIVIIGASQELWSRTAVCYPIHATGHFMYYVYDDNEELEFIGFGVMDGDGEPMITVQGKRPEGWIVKPNEGVVEICRGMDRVLLDAVLQGTSIEIPEKLLPEVTEVDTVKDGKGLRFDMSNVYLFRYDPTPLVADVSINVLETALIVRTDKPVSIKLFDVSSGRELMRVPARNGSVNIPISDLPTGCRYSVVVEQEIDRMPFILKRVGFCK